MKQIIIGSARIDEKGRTSGGLDGDQKQTGAPDYKGEVSLQPFYIHKLGWIILRPVDNSTAEKIAFSMQRACDNNKVGYNQSKRTMIIKDGTDSKKKTSCDCGTLVRRCVIEGAGVDAGNFTTANEVQALSKTGLFTIHEYKKGEPVYKGDILVTKTKGHTVIVVYSNCVRETSTKKTVDDIAREVIKGKWGVGAARRMMLQMHGYDFGEVQGRVNEILRGM